jgi:hypothetical protein
MDHQDWKTNYIIGKGKFTTTDPSKVTVAPKITHKGTGKAPHLIDDDIMSGNRV